VALLPGSSIVFTITREILDWLGQDSSCFDFKSSVEGPAGSDIAPVNFLWRDINGHEVAEWIRITLTRIGDSPRIALDKETIETRFVLRHLHLARFWTESVDHHFAMCDTSLVIMAFFAQKFWAARAGTMMIHCSRADESP
jgi:hypothetical protein